MNSHSPNSFDFCVDGVSYRFPVLMVSVDDSEEKRNRAIALLTRYVEINCLTTAIDTLAQTKVSISDIYAL